MIVSCCAICIHAEYTSQKSKKMACEFRVREVHMLEKPCGYYMENETRKENITRSIGQGK